MKTQEWILRLALLGMALSLTACPVASKKSTSNVPSISVTPGQVYIPPTTGPGYNPGANLIYGGTAPLTVPSLSVMGQYTGRPMNQVLNPRINLNMVKTSGGTFGGTATVTYTENGYQYQGYFTAGDSDTATQYNRMFTYGGSTVWHGIFEDYMGGLVVVIDGIVDLGDGQGPQDTVNGSVWFKNFRNTYAPHPPTYCWFVLDPWPYDCRPWPNNDGVNTFADKNPQNGYVKLGTFTGLSIKAAFNNDTLY